MWHDDACLIGMGGVWNNQVYTGRIPSYMMNRSDLNITHFELINNVGSIEDLWSVCQGKRVHIIHNMSVVFISTSGYIKDTVLASYI